MERRNKINQEDVILWLYVTDILMAAEDARFFGL